MKKNRRDFLKLSTLAGLGIGAGTATAKGIGSKSDVPSPGRARSQTFNMSGYSAPKLDTVRVGFIGLGQRGPGHVVRSSKIENVEINGLCDLRPEKVDATLKRIEGSGHKPALYSGDENAWKNMCDRKDIDLVYISSPWDLHAPMAVYAMKQGKHVAIEVPGVLTME